MGSVWELDYYSRPILDECIAMFSFHPITSKFLSIYYSFRTSARKFINFKCAFNNRFIAGLKSIKKLRK